jgi:prepilin-type N-terminal cleavage/methylation domain-containing protein
MIQKIKSQNISYNAFTLIEMLIVLIIMGIMLMVTLLLSWDQIQKVRDKTVKESILVEMQSRYSRNLWSSSFGWTIYDHLDIELLSWSNEIIFSYYTWDSEKPFLINNFIDNFEIKYMAYDYDFESNSWAGTGNIRLQYSPYKIFCKIWDGDNTKNLVLVARVNDSRNYCFEIKQKNCRLVEIPEEKCNNLLEKYVTN